MNKPNRRTVPTDSGLHSMMKVYADSLRKPLLRAQAHYADGSVFTDTFERAQKDISYKGHDGETYEQGIDTGKFCRREYGLYGPVTSASLKKWFKEFSGTAEEASEKIAFTFELIAP